MARLNEPLLPATESLDALKRRFIRQNREIARVNSSQSQRIRNLETEISRLLSENISLREVAIRAKEEADKLRTSNRLGRDVISLHGKLAAKLEEVNSMVAMLGGLPEKAARRSSIRPRRSSASNNALRSPDPKEWRNRQNLGGILNPEQEGRLPAILEDKYYPRRTLEPAELRALGVEEDNQDVESPDLGPPPVVHFDVNEPIVFDSNKSPRRISDAIVIDEGNIGQSSNFETRRKRRTSSLMHDLTVAEDTEAPKLEDEPQPITAANKVTKRKMVTHELDEPQNAAPQDDFVFQRKPTTTADKPKPSRFAPRPSRQNNAGPEEQVRSPQRPLSTTRQALAPKTTNSPTKRVTSSTALKKDLSRAEIADDKKPRITRISAVAKTERPRHIDIPPIQDIKPTTDENQPKTPGAALIEIMSPETLSTEPSTKSRSNAKAEIAFTNSVEDVLNGSIGRGSRRVRAAVSYAEPNLRDKMRRPDKKLVGAVEGLVKPAGGENPLSRSLTSEPAELTEARESVRHESSTNPEVDQFDSEIQKGVWPSVTSAEATSPLNDKKRTQVLERRHKRTFSEVEGTSLKTLPRTATEDVRSSMEQMSIFDPPSSSPIAPKHEESDRPPSRTEQIPSAMSRRSSSTTNNVTSTTSALKTRRHSIQVQPLSSTAPPTRPNSATSTRETASKDTSGTKLKRASSVQALTRPKEPAVVVDEGETSMMGSRTMTTRRRSMMV